MDYLAFLRADFQRLVSVSEAALESKVPTCPDWTVNDLVDHVAHVYLHKVECMRRNAAPDPWPTPGLDRGPRLPLLHRAYDELLAEFAARPADSASFTWFEPDQSVGFWMRRMAQETVIHRIDAELAAGVPSLPVPVDLALDGVDEVLGCILTWPSTMWADAFAEALEPKQTGSVAVVAGDRRWVVSWSPSGVITLGDGDAEAEIAAAPEQMLRWLWRRSEGPVTVSGDEAKAAQLRRLMEVATG